MDIISGSFEMNDSQGGSFVTDFYHFTHFTGVFSPNHHNKNCVGSKIIPSVGLPKTQHFY